MTLSWACRRAMQAKCFLKIIDKCLRQMDYFLLPGAIVSNSLQDVGGS